MSVLLHQVVVRVHVHWLTFFVDKLFSIPLSEQSVDGFAFIGNLRATVPGTGHRDLLGGLGLGEGFDVEEGHGDLR